MKMALPKISIDGGEQCVQSEQPKPLHKEDVASEVLASSWHGCADFVDTCSDAAWSMAAMLVVDETEP